MRQGGKTTTIAALLSYYMVFNSDYTIAILANKAEKASEILSRIKLMYEEMPMWLKPSVLKWNERSVKFGNGNNLFSSATTEAAIRGYSVNCVYLDEFAHVDNADAFYESVYPVISSGKDSKIIITSTPKKINLFYHLFNNALSGKNLYIPKKYTWRAHPNRDEKWKEETIKNTSESSFLQEHECEFIGSNDSLIDRDALLKLTSNDPIETGFFFKRYNPVKKENNYLISVDSSEGIGLDYSVISVINITKRPYSIEYIYRNNKISPWKLPEIIYSLALEYNNAYLLIESNNNGKIVVDYLSYEFDYDNIISNSIKKGEQILGEGAGGFSYQLGLRVSKKTKAIGCTTLKALIEKNEIMVNDYELINELVRFVKKGNSYGADEGHDDIVMTLVNFSYFTTTTLFEDFTNTSIREILKEIDEHDDNISFMFYSDGTEKFSSENMFNKAVHH